MSQYSRWWSPRQSFSQLILAVYQCVQFHSLQLVWISNPCSDVILNQTHQRWTQHQAWTDSHHPLLDGVLHHLHYLLTNYPHSLARWLWVRVFELHFQIHHLRRNHVEELLHCFIFSCLHLVDLEEWRLQHRFRSSHSCQGVRVCDQQRDSSQ